VVQKVTKRSKDEDCDVDYDDESDTGVDAVERDKRDETEKTRSTRLITSNYQHHGERRDTAEQREGPSEYDEQSDPTEVTAWMIHDSTHSQVLNHGGNEHVRLTYDF